MDAAVIHSNARTSLESIRSVYRQELAEFKALEDIVTNISEIFPAEHVKILESELTIKLEKLNNLQNSLFAKTQIVSYLAGCLINEADMKNAQ